MSDALDAEHDLVQRGFGIVKHIYTDCTSCPQGEFSRYIKVYNRSGNAAYVELDLPAVVEERLDAERWRWHPPLQTIPYSYKLGIFACIEREAWGAMVEFDGGYHLLTTDDRRAGAPLECSFVPAQVEGQVAISPSHLIAYPVVLYSQIRQQPDLVHVAVDTASVKLRRQQDEFAEEAIYEIQKSIRELWDEAEALIQTWKQRRNKIQEDLELLPTPEMALTPDQLSYNLYLRHHDHDKVNKHVLTTQVDVAEASRELVHLLHHRIEHIE